MTLGLDVERNRQIALSRCYSRLSIIARKDGAEAKLYSRLGNDFTRRFPLIIEALASLRSRSCTIDGEAVACGEDGVASFERIRYRRHDREFSPTLLI